MPVKKELTPTQLAAQLMKGLPATHTPAGKARESYKLRAAGEGIPAITAGASRSTAPVLAEALVGKTAVQLFFKVRPTSGVKLQPSKDKANVGKLTVTVDNLAQARKALESLPGATAPAHARSGRRPSRHRRRPTRRD